MANIKGTAANDNLVGTVNNDVIDGLGGADTMAGGLGNDVYVVDNIGDMVIENAGAGIDTVQANISYMLTANVENLQLTGTANINGTGNILNNSLTGNSGNNILDGGAGVDTMAGGAVLVLDEPTEGIQPSIIKDIGRAIRYLRDSAGITILLVEQYLDFCRELADRVFIMDRGEIVHQGEASDLDRADVRKHLTV